MEAKDELMTLRMTREVFPHFKKLLETTTFMVGEDEVHITVDEPRPGVITLSSWSRKRQGGHFALTP